MTAALEILENMHHRGAAGADPSSGDGAGLLVGMPTDFMRRVAQDDLSVTLGGEGSFAVGNVFFAKSRPGDQTKQASGKRLLDDELKRRGLTPLGWRQVPTDDSGLGVSARVSQPSIEQIFVGKPEQMTVEEFEQRLFLARRVALNHINPNSDQLSPHMYVNSLSSRTITYKGMLLAGQMSFYKDLSAEDFVSGLAMVHARFSTNTFPNWSRAHPYRMIAHNGEINTLRANINAIRIREADFAKGPLGESLMAALPTLPVTGFADSQALDNLIELLAVASNRSLAHVVMALVPSAWHSNPKLTDEQRAFFKYHSSLFEGWDGPALVAFTDGRQIGAQLDRNGLRPCRYYVLHDDRLVLASEVGVLPELDAKLIKKKGRLSPGRMLLVDVEKGTVQTDEDVLRELVAEQPYKQWIDEHSFELPRDSVTEAARTTSKGSDGASLSSAALYKQLRTFGYTRESIDLLLWPMVTSGGEAMGSMGDDAALACLSERPRPVSHYFKQLFAQVTNPSLDPLREKNVMSIASYVGPNYPVLSEPSPLAVSRLWLSSPLLSPTDMRALRALKQWKIKTIATGFAVSDGPEGLRAALEAVVEKACTTVEKGSAQAIVLSNVSSAACSDTSVPIPALLAVGAVHTALVQRGLRGRVALIAETGDAMFVHDFCTLLGYGCDAVHPTMAYEAMNLKADVKLSTAYANYRTAVEAGIYKVLAKVGISTLQGYKSAACFEALGIASDVIDTCFPTTASPIAGLDFTDLGAEAIARHRSGYVDPAPIDNLPNPGDFHLRSSLGAEQSVESHINTPAAVHTLQNSARSNSRAAFARFSAEHNANVGKVALRGLLRFKELEEERRIATSDVLPASEIVKHFRSGAMSYGSISEESHKAIGIAMNRMGASSNSGEGGEDETRWRRSIDGDLASSSIKQVASGRFGVTIEYLSYANELQIKMSQGAKPGEGGELAGTKVTPEIAKTRGCLPGTTLVSPPPMHDIYSIEDLRQLIWDLKNANPQARISVKLVSKTGVGVIAAGVAKAKADHIVISGGDGGTGAAKWTGIKHAGSPWEIGLAEAHQTLVANGLRSLVTLECDGHLRTGADVVKAALLGAQHFGFGTAPLIALGCVMMRVCHTGNCPVGIATQDPELRKFFTGQPEHVVNYFFLVAEEVREILASLGLHSLAEAVGRVDLLEQLDVSQRSSKAAKLDLSPLLQTATVPLGLPSASLRVEEAKREMQQRLDQQLHDTLRGQLGRALPSFLALPIRNIHRSVGASVSNDIVKLHGLHPDVPEDMVHVQFQGSAGQSFGAFLSKGVCLQLQGDANDGVGKGLSGGTISIAPQPASTFRPEENVIAGNACLYGATAGKLFLNGIAGERFGVRNSGAWSVVEGCGDHGCSYMTAGRVVVLGDIGHNFASGMSGGIAYVYDPLGVNKPRIVPDNVDLVGVGERDDLLKSLIQQHLKYTASPVAALILSNWEENVSKFIKVFPKEYRRTLRATEAERRQAEAQRLERLTPTAGRVHQIPVRARAYSTSTSSGRRPTRRLQEAHDDDKKESKSKKKKQQHQQQQQVALPTSVETPQKDTGFMEYGRQAAGYKPARQRVKNFNEIWKPMEAQEIKTQSARCMDCGVPFCHDGNTFGCPLGNKIPEWNELVHKDQWKEAFQSLMSTNNFPEFTSKVCPAPCEGACVLGSIAEPVAIKSMEMAIIDRAYEEGWMQPNPPAHRTGHRVAVIGGGPAGLAAADQLNKAGHWVTVYERADEPGGLMRFGVPDPKVDKVKIVGRRMRILQEEGITFVCGNAGNVGGGNWYGSSSDSTKPTHEAPSMEQLEQDFDAVLLATGSTLPRTIDIPGSHLLGIHPAMEFLYASQHALGESGSRGNTWRKHIDPQAFIDAHGKDVIVIGAGDTGTDCVATCVRMGAASVKQFDLVAVPPKQRALTNPWPEWPKVFRVDYGHEEAIAQYGEDPRHYTISASEFIEDQNGSGTISGVRTHAILPNGYIVPGSEKVWPANLVLLAMGFLGPEVIPGTEPLVDQSKRLYKANYGQYTTSKPNVFAAGDCRRGQSLVVWAISEGRQAAQVVQDFLSRVEPKNDRTLRG